MISKQYLCVGYSVYEEAQLRDSWRGATGPGVPLQVSSLPLNVTGDSFTYLDWHVQWLELGFLASVWVGSWAHSLPLPPPPPLLDPRLPHARVVTTTSRDPCRLQVPYCEGVEIVSAADTTPAAAPVLLKEGLDPGSECTTHFRILHFIYGGARAAQAGLGP